MVKVDCHLHTVRSGDSVLTLDDLARRIEEVGLDVVCVTDHHYLTAAFEAQARDMGARIVVGEEIRTPVGEVIGLFLTERIPYVIPLEDVVRQIRDQGGVVYVPHPLDAERDSMGDAQVRALHAAGGLDVIEVFNAKIANEELNAGAAAIAADLGVPGAAGSDAHDAPGVGAAWVEMPDFDGARDFVDKLSRGTVVGEYRPHADRFVRRAGVS